MSDLMMKNLMKMVSQILPPKEDPTNEISVFVDNKLSEMIPDQEIATMFCTVFVSYCNKEPEAAYRMLIGFVNDVIELNKELLEDEED